MNNWYLNDMTPNNTTTILTTAVSTPFTIQYQVPSLLAPVPAADTPEAWLRQRVKEVCELAQVA